MIEVFIPTWDSERTLRRCLSALFQNPNVEVTLVDRFSSDATLDIAEDFTVKVVQGNYNLGEARTAICKLAKGEWFFMLDSDVYVSAIWVAVMLLWRNILKNVGALQSHDIHRPVIPDEGFAKVFAKYARWQEEKLCFPHNPKRLDTNATLFCKSAVKGFSSKSACYEDYELGCHIRRQHYDCWAVDVPVVHEEYLTGESLRRRCRIAGAWMRKTGFSSLARLLGGLTYTSLLRVPWGAKRFCVGLYANQIYGYLRSKTYLGERW